HTIAPKTEFFKYLGVDHFGQSSRAAAGKSVNDIEDTETVDRIQDDDSSKRWTEEGKSDLPELHPFAGTIDGGCFIVFLRDHLQTCQQDHHIPSCHSPDLHSHGGTKGGGCFREPGMGETVQTKECEDGV